MAPYTLCKLLKPRRAGSVASVMQEGWPLDGVVGPIRLELMTSRLSSVRSNQLSYGPIGRIDQILVRQADLEERDPFLGSRSPHRPERLMRSGKRNEDGGDPLTVYNRNFNRIVVRQEPGRTSLERR